MGTVPHKGLTVPVDSARVQLAAMRKVLCIMGGRMRGRRIPYQIIGKHIRQCLGTFLKKRSEHETVGGSYLKGGASDNSDRINTDFTRGPYILLRHSIPC